MQALRKSAVLFVAIGLALYAAVYLAAERLQYATGRSNPFFKIATASRTEFDWLILGASHAMPLDFADFNAFMERETGLKIINLASPGTGPLYNRFVLENFLREHRTKHLLYVVDSFAFQSPAWNEDRFTDVKLLRRTPFAWATAGALFDYTRREGIAVSALLDFVSGFSKINNRERFDRDVWEGEVLFERIYRPSSTALKKRVDYLYPQPASPDHLARYVAVFADLVAIAQRHDIEVVLIDMPVPAQFRNAKPGDPAFVAALARLTSERRTALHDLSTALPESRFYFDTDHLNRTGLTELFARHLRRVLVAAPAAWSARPSTFPGRPASPSPSSPRESPSSLPRSAGARWRPTPRSRGRRGRPWSDR